MLAIQAKTIYTVTKGTIKDGTILIKDGKIQDVLDRVDIPAGYSVIDASLSRVSPGFIDAHTHLGAHIDGAGDAGNDANEMTDPITPHLHIMDSINPYDKSFREVLESGVTTVMIMPGSANLFGGMCAALKTHGKGLYDMLFIKDAGIKMAMGENPKRVYGVSMSKPPYTRMGEAGLIREIFTKTGNYLKKKASAKGKNEEFLETDLKFEAITRLLSGEVPARFHAHSANDLLTAIRLSEEYGFRISLEHCTEGPRIAEEIARRSIPVTLSPLMGARNKVETAERSFKTPAILYKEGVKFAISTDGTSTVQWLAINAGLAVREGLPEEEALKSITITPAEIIGAKDRLGSIEPGKDADLVLFSGHPLENLRVVEMVIVNGEIVHNRGLKVG